ncbi:hypothetical protein ACF0H5_004719 [Mactra antiquata]
MGTPASKTDDTVVTSQDVPIRDIENTGKISVARSADSNDEESTQILCAYDDGPLEDDELVDTYTSLKTNTDNHVMNTRFDRNSLQSLPSIGSIVEKELFTPNGRICSANGRVTARFISAEMLSADKLKARDSYSQPPDDISENSLEEIADNSIELDDDVEDVDRTENGNEIADNDCSSDDGDEVQPEELGDNCLDDKADIISLPSSKQEDILSPDPKLSQIETDIDVSQVGLHIPRKRLNSVGMLSIISGIEPLEDMNYSFYEDIKKLMAKQGYFDKFPSPVLINEAHEFYRTLELTVPLDDENAPAPHPPYISTHELMMSTANGKVFETIEKMPAKIKTTSKPSEICNYLCKSVTDDALKLYTIVTYLVCQQLETGVPFNKHRITETSLKLCKTLRTYCKLCKIKSTIIKGIVRESSYSSYEGDYGIQKFWMAVSVKKSWILVDPIVYSTFDNSSHNNHETKVLNKEFVSKCVEGVFQVPSQFIFSNYPDEEIWQLLARPVLEEELPDMAHIYHGFFKYNMELLTHVKYNIEASENEILISIRFASSEFLQFKCSYSISDNSLTSSETRKYVFMETVLFEHKVYMRVRFPKRGIYYLDLFGSTSDSDWLGIVSYRLIYEGGDEIKPFPDNPREEWGPGIVAKILGLEPVMYHSGEIITRKAVLQIAFKDRNYLHFEFYAEPVDILSLDYLKVSFLKDRKQNVIFVVEIDSKINGTFILRLFAKQPDSAGDFKNFCNYFVKKEKSTIIPTLIFDSKENTIVKDAIPADADGTMSVVIDSTNYNHITANLQLHGGQDIDCGNHVRIWLDEKDTAHIYLNFPRAGRYKFTARGLSRSSGNNVTIKDETIDVSMPSRQWSIYPKQLHWWENSFNIVQPLTHYLREKELVTFRVYLINAQDVAVVGPGGWNHLMKGDKKDLWEGQVYSGPRSTRCRLQARFEKGSDRWSELLWYKVISIEDYQRMEDKQSSMRETNKTSTPIADDEQQRKVLEF